MENLNILFGQHTNNKNNNNCIKKDFQDEKFSIQSEFQPLGLIIGNAVTDFYHQNKIINLENFCCFQRLTKFLEKNFLSFLAAE